MSGDLTDLFPRMLGSDFTVTSRTTQEYNCVAWAVGEDDRWWWPDPNGDYTWPEGALRLETLEAFVEAFTLLGYEICDNAEHESGFEKLALYATPDGAPRHVARQLASGSWTSKLGQLEDIVHANLESLIGDRYGRPVAFLRRPLQPAPDTPT